MYLGIYKKEAMDLRESKRRYKGGFGGKRKWEVLDYAINQKINKC